MADTIKVVQSGAQTIKVNQTQSVITTQTPVTLRNTASDFNSIDKMLDVTLASRANNSTLIYNSVTDKYEVRPIDETIITITSVDGGSF